MTMRIEHWPEDGMVRIDLAGDGEQSDHGHEVGPGVFFHYRRTEDGPDRLVSIEIMDGPGRDLSEVELFTRDAGGNAVFPAQFTEALAAIFQAQEEVVRHLPLITPPTLTRSPDLSDRSGHTGGKT